VETADVVTQILNRFQSAAQGQERFGRSESKVHRIGAGKLVELARALKSEAGFDWLENLSASDGEKEIVFTYFLRSSATHATLILRSSAPVSKGSGIAGEPWVTMESLVSVWPMVGPKEKEIAPLFGVRFSGGSDPEIRWEGFPLRKSYDVIGAAGGAAVPGGVLP